MLTHTSKVDITPGQYKRIQKARKRYEEEEELRKEGVGQQTEASKGENKSLDVEKEKALKKCDGLMGEQSLKDEAPKEEPSNTSSRPQEVDKIFASKGICKKLPAMLNECKRITEGLNFR